MSRLLLLPAELREQIYIYTVVDSSTLAIVHPTLTRSSRPSIRVLQPALSKVCRQLRNEVLPIFYSHNAFHLPCSLSFKARSAIQNIADRSQPGWLLRESANEVQLILIMQYAQIVMAKFEMLRGWLRQIGREKWKVLGKVVLCCRKGEEEILKELMGVRFDYKFLQVTESDAPLLEEGWVWEGMYEEEKECRGFGNEAAGRAHYVLRYEEAPS